MSGKIKICRAAAYLNMGLHLTPLRPLTRPAAVSSLTAFARRRWSPESLSGHL